MARSPGWGAICRKAVSFYKKLNEFTAYRYLIMLIIINSIMGYIIFRYLVAGNPLGGELFKVVPTGPVGQVWSREGFCALYLAVLGGLQIGHSTELLLMVLLVANVSTWPLVLAAAKFSHLRLPISALLLLVFLHMLRLCTMAGAAGGEVDMFFQLPGLQHQSWFLYPSLGFAICFNDAPGMAGLEGPGLKILVEATGRDYVFSYQGLHRDAVYTLAVKPTPSDMAALVAQLEAAGFYSRTDLVMALAKELHTKWQFVPASDAEAWVVILSSGLLTGLALSFHYAIFLGLAALWCYVIDQIVWRRSDYNIVGHPIDRSSLKYDYMADFLQAIDGISQEGWASLWGPPVEFFYVVFCVLLLCCALAAPYWEAVRGPLRRLRLCNCGAPVGSRLPWSLRLCNCWLSGGLWGPSFLRPWAGPFPGEPRPTGSPGFPEFPELPEPSEPSEPSEFPELPEPSEPSEPSEFPEAPGNPGRLSGGGGLGLGSLG